MEPGRGGPPCSPSIDGYKKAWHGPLRRFFNCSAMVHCHHQVISLQSTIRTYELHPIILWTLVLL